MYLSELAQKREFNITYYLGSCEKEYDSSNAKIIIWWMEQFDGLSIMYEQYDANYYLKMVLIQELILLNSKMMNDHNHFIMTLMWSISCWRRRCRLTTVQL